MRKLPKNLAEAPRSYKLFIRQLKQTGMQLEQTVIQLMHYISYRSNLIVCVDPKRSSLNIANSSLNTLQTIPGLPLIPGAGHSDVRDFHWDQIRDTSG